jgi:plastocyanin
MADGEESAEKKPIDVVVPRGWAANQLFLSLKSFHGVRPPDATTRGGKRGNPLKNGWIRRVFSGSLVLLAIVFLAGCGDDDDDGAVVPVTHSISGQVSLDNGSELSGVTMALTGASSDNVITDASGNYTFTGLDNGSYIITPSRTGYTFSPTDNTQIVSGANITGVNFTATAVQAVTYSISGQTALDNGSGLSGVTVALTGASSDNVITDTSGNYTFTGLDNGSYIITPSRTGFTFSPTGNTQTVSGADITGVNFTATATQSAQAVTCPASGTTDVTIQDNFFTPDNVTISANEIVKWTNNGTTHTVTSGNTPTPDGKFDSGNLETGATFCVQFFTTGPHPYFCTIHQMVGLVTVQ